MRGPVKVYVFVMSIDKIPVEYFPRRRKRTLYDGESSIGTRSSPFRREKLPSRYKKLPSCQRVRRFGEFCLATG